MYIKDFEKSKVAMMQSECLSEGNLKVMPADFYRQFNQREIAIFCMMNGLYCLPTHELLDCLNELIIEASPSRLAIEIGSGNGALGKGLGIPCTDSFMQDDPVIRAHYASLGQPTVRYGQHVIKIDANKAVDEMRPEVVVGAWVTHLYREEAHELGGNMFGIDEDLIINKTRRYIVVGNKGVHGKKPIMSKAARVIEADFLFSRSLENAGLDAIFVWDKM